jgi:hypothetical protein
MWEGLAMRSSWHVILLLVIVVVIVVMIGRALRRR